VLGLCVVLLLGACRSGETAPASREAPSAADASAAPGAVSAPAAAAASAAQSKPLAWSGTYKSAAGTLYIPPEWKGVRWSGAETQAGIGEGTIALEIDPSTGRVVGTLEGPLGPAVIDGVATGEKLTATIARKNPSDRGFAGSLMGDIGKDAVTGSMNLSSAEASTVRTATFSLAPGH
jgi:hypothetical protein